MILKSMSKVPISLCHFILYKKYILNIIFTIKKDGYGLGVTVKTVKCVHMRGVVWGPYFSHSYLSGEL